MTEDEAKTKWCPQARVPTHTGHCARNRDLPLVNDDGRPSVGTYCIASGCMAWRETSTRHGYCGLAGRPRA
jgi:hypothetical protein